MLLSVTEQHLCSRQKEPVDSALHSLWNCIKTEVLLLCNIISPAKIKSYSFQLSDALTNDKSRHERLCVFFILFYLKTLLFPRLTWIFILSVQTRFVLGGMEMQPSECWTWSCVLQVRQSEGSCDWHRFGHNELLCGFDGRQAGQGPGELGGISHHTFCHCLHQGWRAFEWHACQAPGCHQRWEHTVRHKTLDWTSIWWSKRSERYVSDCFLGKCIKLKQLIKTKQFPSSFII